MTSEKKIKLSTGDKALLEAAQIGEGLIEVTPSLMDGIGKAINARNEDIKARYPKLVEDCPYETRLAVTAWIMENIITHATDGGTFRYLIYDRLGFKSDAYLPLYNAGGMTISNEFDLTKETKE